MYPLPNEVKLTWRTPPSKLTAEIPEAAYVNPVGVPTVVTIATSAVVVNVNPVTLGVVPVIAEILYVFPVV